MVRLVEFLQYNTFSDIYNRFKLYGKPMMIAEFASTELGGDKSHWIRETFLYTKGLFPNIKALTWFNTNMETDWRINSTSVAAVAYQQSIADGYFLANISTTSVHTQRPSGNHFELLPPSPNPLNGGVRFSFVIPETMKSNLRVYNLLGQEIRLIREGVFEQGQHSWYWNGRDTGGRELPSGISIAVLEANHKRFSQKIILSK